MIDIQALEEKHYECFVNTCINYPIVDFMVKKIVNNHEDPFENASYENCFELLYAWDAEYLVRDAMNCLIAYLEAKNRGIK